jgi:DHA2 family multidrug resistance protein
MPLFFQTSLGLTAFDTGLALLPGAIATAFGMALVGRLIKIVSPRVLTAIGFVLFAASCWALGDLNGNAGIGDIFWPRIVQGLGMAFVFVPVMTAMLAPVPKPELASATGVSMLIRQLGAGLGIAILTTLLARETTVAWTVLAGGVTHTAGVSLSAIDALVAQNASVIAYQYLFRICAFVFVAALPFVYFMKPAKAT